MSEIAPPLTPAQIARGRLVMERLMKQQWFAVWAKEMAQK